jgi:hypothetical protein
MVTSLMSKTRLTASFGRAGDEECPELVASRRFRRQNCFLKNEIMVIILLPQTKMVAQDCTESIQPDIKQFLARKVTRLKISEIRWVANGSPPTTSRFLGRVTHCQFESNLLSFMFHTNETKPTRKTGPATARDSNIQRRKRRELSCWIQRHFRGILATMNQIYDLITRDIAVRALQFFIVFHVFMAV